jgi:hypothetical protein
MWMALRFMSGTVYQSRCDHLRRRATALGVLRKTEQIKKRSPEYATWQAMLTFADDAPLTSAEWQALSSADTHW